MNEAARSLEPLDLDFWAQVRGREAAEARAEAAERRAKRAESTLAILVGKLNQVLDPSLPDPSEVDPLDRSTWPAGL